MTIDESKDLGEVVFRGPKPAPQFANWIAIALLLLGAICVGYWTVTMIRNGSDWRENIFVILFAHVGPIAAAVFVWASMLDHARGQLLFHERGVCFSNGEKSQFFRFAELERVHFIEVQPNDAAALSALQGIFLWKWTKVGKAYGDSKCHWHVVVKPTDASPYPVRILDSTTFETLRLLVPDNKRIDEVE